MPIETLTAASFVHGDTVGCPGSARTCGEGHRAAVASARRAGVVGRWCDLAALGLLILAASALTFRPSDLLPALHKAPIYEALIALCIVASIPRLVAVMATGSLRSHAVVTLLMAMVPAVALSHLAHGNVYDARIGGTEMLKACVFAMLVVALVDTPRRVHTMMLAVVTATLAVTCLSLLHYHGVIDVPALRAVEQANIAAGEGEPSEILRLCGISVFNDPNDFSLLLVVAAAICGYGLWESKGIAVRLIMLVPIAVFTYALLLTHSRGGLVAAVTALLVFLNARLGFRNALPAAVVLVGGLIAVAWGRQTTFDLDNPEDTFQSRLELWNHALDLFRVAPVAGVGQGKAIDVLGLVVHNSYLQAFAELGFLGGAVFAGLFVTTVRALWRARPTDETLARLRPCVLAVVASYGVGLLSLSRCYTVPTQLVVALGASYLSIGRAAGIAVPRFDARFVSRLLLSAVAVLFLIYAAVRLLLAA